MALNGVRPIPTAFSSQLAPAAFWSQLDMITGAGAIILDSSLDKVLVVYDVDSNEYCLPWAVHDRPDIGQFIRSPFDELMKQIGLVVEKYPIPRVQRQYKDPGSRELPPDTQLVYPCTTDPFYTSFDVFWQPIPGAETSPWLDSKQRMLMWFACVATSGAPAEDMAFMSFAEAETKLRDQKYPDTGGLRALQQLVDILTKHRQSEPAPSTT